jgi:hypothetical protein
LQVIVVRHRLGFFKGTLISTPSQKRRQGR